MCKPTDAILADILEVVESGSRPKGGVTTAGDIPSLGGENVTMDGRMTFRELKRIPRSFFQVMPRGHLDKDDVLINKDGAQTGKVSIYDGQFAEACINEHLFLLRANRQLMDQRFLFYALLWEHSQIQIARIRTGSAQAGINTRFPECVTVPVPPIEEQSKITELLTLIDREIEASEAMLYKLIDLNRGLTHALFSCGLTETGVLRDPKTSPDDFVTSPIGLLPASWKLRPFEEIVDTTAPICYGIVQPGPYVADGIPVVTSGDLHGDYGTRLHRTAKAIDANYARSRITAGDVLLSIKGTIGRVDVVPEHFSGNISRDLARIRTGRGISAQYVRYMIDSPHSQVRLRAAVVGTTRPELSINVLKRILVPLPPSDEQKRVAEIAALQRSRLQSEASILEKLRVIKKGLMQDLLTGRVRVNAEAWAKEK